MTIHIKKQLFRFLFLKVLFVRKSILEFHFQLVKNWHFEIGCHREASVFDELVLQLFLQTAPF